MLLGQTDRFRAGGGLCHHIELRVGLDDAAQTLPQQRVIVGHLDETRDVAAR